MANLTEVPTYEAGIYRFETTDPVQGGPGGIDNLPTNQLANRTAWLKAQVEAILLDIAAIESGYATAASLAGHTGNTSNPHSTTAAQVGLGNVQNYGIATQAEAEACASDTKYMTPAKLAAAFAGGNRSVAASGFQRLPGGLLIQWGFGSSAADGSAAVTWPVAFPNAAIAALAVNSTGAQAPQSWPGVGEISKTGGTFWNASSAGASAGSGQGVRYVVIGY